MHTRKNSFVIPFLFLALALPAQGLLTIPQPHNSLELPAIQPTDTILSYTGFTVNYNPDQLIPNWVAYELTAEELDGEVPRAKGFSMDLNYKGRQAMREDYSNTGWDKGHMAPSADMKWSQSAMTESFYLTNICPQNPDLNGRDWHILENRVRDWARLYGRVWVVCGPLVQDNRYGAIGERQVTVPDGFFKAILRQESDGAFRAIAFIFENSSARQPLKDAVITVYDLESLTGYDFFPYLNDSIEEAIESKNSWEDWH